MFTKHMELTLLVSFFLLLSLTCSMWDNESFWVSYFSVCLFLLKHFRQLIKMLGQSSRSFFSSCKVRTFLHHWFCVWTCSCGNARNAKHPYRRMAYYQIQWHWLYTGVGTLYCSRAGLIWSFWCHCKRRFWAWSVWKRKPKSSGKEKLQPSLGNRRWRQK